MNKKQKRNGFTIVELVIVIAVIGILSAVLIPTFSNLIKKSKQSADQQLVYHLNEAVVANEVDNLAKGKNGTEATMYDTLQVLDKEYGFTVERMTPRSGNDIVWDSTTNRFALVAKDNTVIYTDPNRPTVDMTKKAQMWRITEAGETLGDGYSHYLTAGWSGAVEVETGVDVGENDDVTSVTYARDGSAQTVVIRTNGGNTTLNINAPSDTVEHYGLVGVVNIEAIDDSSSYHEHDTANLIQVANGRVALENGSKVSKIHLTATEGNFNNITVAKTSNVKMPEFSRDPVEIPEGGKLVVALQEGTEKVTSSTQLDYVWLTAVGIYEQVVVSDQKVSLTADGANNSYAAASNDQEKKDTAQQIANNITATIGENSYIVTANYNTNNSEWEYNLVDKNGNYTAFVVETVSVSVSEGSATASITVTDQTADAVTSNNTNDTADMVDNAKNTVVEVTFKGQKTLLGMSEFRNKWNNGDFYDEANPVSVKLLANCNLKEENWGPIGTWKYPFFGTFDGNGKTISNLTNHNAADENGKYTHIYSIGNSVGYGETYGFFGIVGGGNTIIKDVTFDSVDIDVTNGKNVGAVIGYVPAQDAQFNEDIIHTIGSVTLSGVIVNGSVQGKSHVAGLIGKMYSSGDLSFENCVNNASITSSGSYCAGFVAITKATNTTLTSCANNGDVNSGSDSVGGFAGRCTNEVTFDNCKNTGNITSTNASSYVGGLLGCSNANTTLYFNYCENTGDITGGTAGNSGGFFGGTSQGDTKVCFTGTAKNSGKITGNYASNFIGNLSGACDFDTGTKYDTNTVGNSPNLAISCIKHSGVVFTTADVDKLVTTNGKIAKYWIISGAHGAIVNNLESESFETNYDATGVNNYKF